MIQSQKVRFDGFQWHEICLKWWFHPHRRLGCCCFGRGPSCMHVSCTVASLNAGNNLSIKVLGYWVTFPKYRALIVWLHKSHVMLGAWAASALTWCYFQTSLVMPTHIFGPPRIKFRAVSARHPSTPPREENKEENKSHFRRGTSARQCFTAWRLISLKASNFVLRATDHGSEETLHDYTETGSRRKFSKSDCKQVLSAWGWEEKQGDVQYSSNSLAKVKICI